MILEILETKCVKVEGDVQAYYKTGETAIYHSDKIEHLVINPEAVVSIIINKKNK